MGKCRFITNLISSFLSTFQTSSQERLSKCIIIRDATFFFVVVVTRTTEKMGWWCSLLIGLIRLFILNGTNDLRQEVQFAYKMSINVEHFAGNSTVPPSSFIDIDCVVKVAEKNCYLLSYIIYGFRGYSLCHYCH